MFYLPIIVFILKISRTNGNIQHISATFAEKPCQIRDYSVENVETDGQVIQLNKWERTGEWQFDCYCVNVENGTETCCEKYFDMKQEEDHSGDVECFLQGLMRRKEESAYSKLSFLITNSSVSTQVLNSTLTRSEINFIRRESNSSNLLIMLEEVDEDAIKMTEFCDGNCTLEQPDTFFPIVMRTLRRQIDSDEMIIKCEGIDSPCNLEEAKILSIRVLQALRPSPTGGRTFAEIRKEAVFKKKFFVKEKTDSENLIGRILCSTMFGLFFIPILGISIWTMLQKNENREFLNLTTFQENNKFEEETTAKAQDFSQFAAAVKESEMKQKTPLKALSSRRASQKKDSSRDPSNVIHTAPEIDPDPSTGSNTASSSTSEKKEGSELFARTSSDTIMKTAAMQSVRTTRTSQGATTMKTIAAGPEFHGMVVDNRKKVGSTEAGKTARAAPGTIMKTVVPKSVKPEKKTTAAASKIS